MATINARMRQRRRTAAQWTTEDPVLDPAEFGVESDTGKIKVGDGTSTWSALVYAAVTAAEATAISQFVTGTAVDALPELATSDSAKMPLSTAGGITTLDVERLAPEVAWLTADSTPVNNSTALVDVPGLAVPVEANAVYIVTALIRYKASQTADFQLAFTSPAGSSGEWNQFGLTLAAPGSEGAWRAHTRTWDDSPGLFGGSAVGSAVGAAPHGLLITGGTAGTLQARFAQNTAEVTDTVVAAHSWLRAERVG